MESQDLDPELIELGTEAMNGLAKHLGECDRAEIAAALVRQAAEIELLSPALQKCWGGPFNGQDGRVGVVEELIAAVSPQAIVETGTFRGISTLWFAEHFSGPIWSCEKEELYLIQSQQRLRAFANVQLEHADSREFLKRRCKLLDSDKPTFFYLDSHWELDLPLREELRIIFVNQPNAVVMIDDFKVPGDPGYGWDDYGLGLTLDTTILSNLLPTEVSVYCPVLPSAEESGAKRGCCVVALGSRAMVDTCQLLKRVDLSGLNLMIDPPDRGEADGNSALPLKSHLEVQPLALSSSIREFQRELVKVRIQSANRHRDMRSLIAELKSTRGEIGLLRSDHVQQLRDNERLSLELSESQSAVNSLRSENNKLAGALKVQEEEVATANERIARLTKAILTLQTELKLRGS